MGSHITSNKGKLRGKIEKVKSKYILQKIFDNIGKDKTIKIVNQIIVLYVSRPTMKYSSITKW